MALQLLTKTVAGVKSLLRKAGGIVSTSNPADCSCCSGVGPCDPNCVTCPTHGTNYTVVVSGWPLGGTCSGVNGTFTMTTLSTNPCEIAYQSVSLEGYTIEFIGNVPGAGPSPCVWQISITLCDFDLAYTLTIAKTGPCFPPGTYTLTGGGLCSFCAPDVFPATLTIVVS